ncbi:hypothetical protein [Streptomyces lannensis]|uniref:Uncharacterized protein n=1 Tax=Streptomyces lannensis TaxID=766498 RepID=A0ABP7LGA8_9ACTN
MESQNVRSGYLTGPPERPLLNINLSDLGTLVRRGQLQRAGGSSGQLWYVGDDVDALAATHAMAKAA